MWVCETCSLTFMEDHKLNVFHVFHVCALKNILYLYDKPTNALYKYMQSHIIILRQHVSVTPVTVIRVCYNKRTFTIQIIVHKFMLKPLSVMLYFSVALPYSHKISAYIITKMQDNKVCLCCILDVCSWFTLIRWVKLCTVQGTACGCTGLTTTCWRIICYWIYL
jgi:hypothetical protein